MIHDETNRKWNYKTVAIGRTRKDEIKRNENLEKGKQEEKECVEKEQRRMQGHHTGDSGDDAL